MLLNLAELCLLNWYYKAQSSKGGGKCLCILQNKKMYIYIYIFHLTDALIYHLHLIYI